MKREEEDTTDEDDAEGLNHLRKRTCVCVQKTVNYAVQKHVWHHHPIHQRTYFFFRAVKTLSCQDSAISKLAERPVTPLHIIYNACTSHVYVLPEARQTDCFRYGKVRSGQTDCLGKVSTDRLFSKGLDRRTVQVR